MTAVLTIGALAGPVMPAGAAPVSGTVTVIGRGATAPLDARSAAERSDLAAIAADRGISVEAATDRVGWQDAFAIAATAVEDAYPDSFSTAKVTSEAPAVGTITFVGAVPAGAAALVAGLPSSVRVDLVPGAAATADQIDEAVIAAHRAVTRTGRVGDVVSSYDEATGTVQVAAQPKSAGLDEAALAAEARSIRTALPASAGKLTLTLHGRVGGRDEARYGGGRLERSGSGLLECTAGFNVATAAGTPGVATAGHCADVLTHENTNGAAETAMNHQAGHQGAWGDFQWHTTSDTEPDDFYYNSSSTRDVSARANPTDGQTICRFGHTTGAQCGTVEDLSTCSTVNGIEVCRLVRMGNDEAEGGDSGGPWYYGNTAYGFHKGDTSCGFLWLSSCDLWSRVTYIDDALGVTVKIS